MMGRMVAAFFVVMVPPMVILSAFLYVQLGWEGLRISLISYTIAAVCLLWVWLIVWLFTR